MPNSEMTPYYSGDWEHPEEEPDQPNAATRITPASYERWSREVLKIHTGSSETYLSSEEEQELAAKIQDGQAAQAERETIEAEIEKAPKLTASLRKRYDDIRKRIRDGRAAEQKLIECNLRLSAYLARASMNILPEGDETAAEDTKAGRRRRALLNERLPWLPRDFTSLKSRFANLDDRIQVANLGLIRAARTYKPGATNKKGDLISFMAFAAPVIKTDLARYIRGGRPDMHEKPIHIPADTGDKIIRAQSEDWDEEFTPEKREELLGWTLLQDMVPLDELYFTGAADEEIDQEDADPTLLWAGEVIPTDEPQDALTAWLIENRRDLLKEVLETLSEREAGVIRLRFGLNDGQTRSLDEVGDVYGVTRERIRQIETKTLEKLRQPIRSRQFLELQSLADHGAQPMRSGDVVKIERSLGRSSFRLMLVPPFETEPQPVSGLRESWQAYPGEAWDEPVRKTPAEVHEAHLTTVNRFKDLLFGASLYTFQKSFTEEVRSSYPKLLAERIETTFGRGLDASHIAVFWQRHLESFLQHLTDQLGDDANPDRATQLLSKLLAERMDDSDVIELRVPKALQGKLNYVGAWLSHGTLRVFGDLGNQVGHEMQSLGHLQVEGNVGHFAGQRMSGNARLEIDGNTGDFTGDLLGGNASILINGDTGNYCGHRMRSRGCLIEVIGQTGAHTGYGATNGEIIVGSTTLRLPS